MDFLHGKHLKCFETLISSIQKLWLYWFKHSTKQNSEAHHAFSPQQWEECSSGDRAGRWMHLNNGFLNQLLCIENPLNTTVARIEEPLQCNMHLAKCIPMHCTHSDSGQYSMLIFQSIPSIQIWFISTVVLHTYPNQSNPSHTIYSTEVSPLSITCYFLSKGSTFIFVVMKAFNICSGDDCGDMNGFNAHGFLL